MNIHNLSVEDVLKTLVTSPGGLSEKDVEARLLEYGPNEIKPVRKKTAFSRFLAQFTHFLAILLWAAAALCLLSETVHPGEGMSSLGVAIVVVIFINAAFTIVQEYRAEKAVEALKKLLPSKVTAVRDGIAVEVASAVIVPGDLIQLGEGDKVPADARVIEANRLTVNNSPLTGEPGSKPRSPAPFDGTLLDSPNVVFAGTLVTSGKGKAVAFATGMATEFGKIAHLTSAVEPGPTPLQREITKATKVIAVIAGTTGVFFFGLGVLIGRGFWHNFLFAVGITIANVPEGLLPTVTLSLAMGSQRMARKNALVKNLGSVETLGSVTVICTDKTGTITENRMEMKKAWAAGEREYEAGGPCPPGMEPLMKAAALCNDASSEGGSYRGDPTETALLKASRAAIGDVGSLRLYEISFDSERKRMSTVNEVGGKTYVFTKGALETVLPLCVSALHSGRPVLLDDSEKAAIVNAAGGMTDSGLRVIAFAFRETAHTMEGHNLTEADDDVLEKDLVFAGLMGLYDPPRPRVAEAVRKCRDAGLRVIMITGDASGTAVAIARQVGLSGREPLVVEGPSMDTMSDAELREALGAGDIIFSRMSPRHKMRVVSVLKDEGEVVAVTGDGVNDAPALRKADVGVAMGLAGTDVAREAADVVLLDDDFATIVDAVDEGRTIFQNIRKFITYIFAHGTPEAVPYILYALFNIPLPLTVMQILAIDLGTETIPALALGTELPEEDTMKRPPMPGRSLIDKALVFRGYIFLGFISAIGALAAYFYVLYSGGWQWGMALPDGGDLARQASTATFLGIVMMQVGNVFACRSSINSIARTGIFSNRMALAGVAAELLLAYAIIYHPFGNRLFGTAPLCWKVWVMLVPFSLGLLAAEEARKYLARRQNSPA